MLWLFYVLDKTPHEFSAVFCHWRYIIGISHKGVTDILMIERKSFLSSSQNKSFTNCPKRQMNVMVL